MFFYVKKKETEEERASVCSPSGTMLHHIQTHYVFHSPGVPCMGSAVCARFYFEWWRQESFTREGAYYKSVQIQHSVKELINKVKPALNDVLPTCFQQKQTVNITHIITF